MDECAGAVEIPLILLSTLPRVLAPVEKVQMPVTVFSTGPCARYVRLEVSSNELFKPVSEEAATSTVRFANPGEQLVYVEMEAGAQTGVARVRINASSGGEDAHYEVELNVRNPRSEEHTSELQSLMRNSYAVFCFKKKKKKSNIT